jgi:hypothetical protein
MRAKIMMNRLDLIVVVIAGKLEAGRANSATMTRQ